MNLTNLNQAETSEAKSCFYQCCSADAWVDAMTANRPYENIKQLRKAADTFWHDMTEQSLLQAFDGHPKIGNVSSLKSKYATTEKLAAGEQSGVATATDQTIEALALGNKTYEEKYGFIFIVCATGKSAAEMLGLLNSRLGNTRDRELIIAAEQQRQIFQLRLQQLIDVK